MADELVQVVDDAEQPMGGATKPDIWKKGLWHRVVRIVVSDAHGNVLLQQRAPTMQLWPGAWDNSSSGHVTDGLIEIYEHVIRHENHGH